jgi:hypothetical protein
VRGLHGMVRTVSLGICAARASTGPGLRDKLSVSDREGPLFTGVNGPLKARRSSADVLWCRVLVSAPSPVWIRKVRALLYHH